MNCCEDERPSPASPSPHASQAARAHVSPVRSWSQRVGALAGWAMPMLALGLIPKCPACVAGYVLVFTGVGISFSAAASLRWWSIALSIAMLAWLVGSRVWRLSQRRLTCSPSTTAR